jgi:hypothetical protein
MVRTTYRAPILMALCCVAFSCGGDDNDNHGGATPTPTTTATAPPQIPCPTKLTYTSIAEGSDLDAGTTGIYFDQQVVDSGSLSFDLSCPGSFLGTCGACALSGPIKSTTVVDNHRCQNASEQVCTSDADCPGSACVFFFGAPVPISEGGVPVCVTNRVNGAVTGTVSPEGGSGASNFNTVWGIHTGIDVAQPCPTCSGSDFNTTGTCSGGDRDGAACTVHGTSALFGNTSFDCPPSSTANVGDLDIPLNLTTGTRSVEPTETCVGGGFAGKPCYCAGQRVPNGCNDGVCTVDAGGEGVCNGGPSDSVCAMHPFISCLGSSDCPSGDSCTSKVRKCAGATDATGTIIAPLSRSGTPGRATQVQVAAFCLGETRSTAVNAAAGLPGPATLHLPTSVCVANVCP